MFNLVKTLSELVATPSINPMGRPADSPDFFEYQLTDYLERFFADQGLSYWRQPISPKRENIIACVPGEPSIESGGGLLLLEAHQDTVPVDGMTISPFDPQIRDGRLSGRGSCDIKGGMAAMLAAMVRLSHERPMMPRPTVVMACTVNEEHGFTGAIGLSRLWSSERSQSHDTGAACPLIPRRPDAAIVAEPTNLNVVVAHKGMVRWRCHTLGRAAHSSQPELGENAIFRMTKVLDALERYQREIVGTLAEHPLCGKPTLNVGLINGGMSVNTVPDRCTIEIDRRLVPGEDPHAAWKHVITYIARETGLGEFVSHDPPLMHSRGLRDTHNRELANSLTAAVNTVTGKNCTQIGVAFGTDAAWYDAAGVPTVVFGPGSITQAHTADEWVPLAEVDQSAEALYQFVTGEALHTKN
jgi:acetylornithine deacetylase/succinyl-diaminopimelate desuccinylase-like protein